MHAFKSVTDVWRGGVAYLCVARVVFVRRVCVCVCCARCVRALRVRGGAGAVAVARRERMRGSRAFCYRGVRKVDIGVAFFDEILDDVEVAAPRGHHRRRERTILQKFHHHHHTTTTTSGTSTSTVC